MTHQGPSGRHAGFSWWRALSPTVRRLGGSAAAVLVAVVAGLILDRLHDRGAPTFSETAGTLVATHENAYNAGGAAGPDIGPGQTVQVSCRVRGLRVPSGDVWWYRVADQPWRNQFYASADPFYNNGSTRGPLAGTPFVDTAVPLCLI